MKYRDRTDIIAKILELASDRPLTKTKLMSMAFLQHEQIEILVPILVENDLLGFNKETHQYRTTPKGLRYVEIYESMKQYVDYIDKAEVCKKKGYWQNELKSLGVDAKGKNHELNDSEELKNLVDALKLSMYQDYKTAYSEQGTKHKEEAESTISV